MGIYKRNSWVGKHHWLANSISQRSVLITLPRLHWEALKDREESVCGIFCQRINWLTGGCHRSSVPIDCKLVVVQLSRIEILPQRVNFLEVITVGVNTRWWKGRGCIYYICESSLWMIRQLFKMITSVSSPSFLPLAFACVTADYARVG